MDAKVRRLAIVMPWLRGKEVTVLPLAGGITNFNYRVDCEGDSYVLRIAGKNSELLGIDRQAEYINSQAAHAVGIGPEVVAYFPEQNAMLSRFVPGKVLASADLRKPAILRRVVKSLRQYHERSNGVGRFCAFATVRRYYLEARKRRVSFPRNIIRALEIMAWIQQETGLPDRLCPCHNDLLPGNLIDDRRKAWVLDWEYAGAGDLFFDLGNLAANNHFDHAQEKRLLQYYFGKARPADLRRLRLMRLASDLREAMWGFLQTGISKLDFDYRTYARAHFKRFLERAEHLVGE